MTRLLLAIVVWVLICACALGFQTSRPSRLTTRRKSPSLHVSRVPLLGRFRKKRTVEQPKPINVGDTIPDVDVEVIRFTSDESQSFPQSIREVLGPGSCVFVGMPGAYTRVCSTEHMPGYLSSVSEFKALGINKIVVMTTNDRHVNEAWGSTYGLNSEDPPITIVSDGDGDLAKAMGLADDMGFGVGVRAKRFAMLVKGGSVATLLTDEGLNDCNQTSARNLLQVIKPARSVDSEEEGSNTFALLGAGAAILLGLLLSLNSADSNSPSLGKPDIGIRNEQRVIQPKSKSFNLLNDYL